jgi:Cu+-exporting ATPase
LAGESKKGRQETTLRVKGMHCATCTQTVKDALLGLEGVEDARVNLATEKATVVYNPRRVSGDDIEKAVKDAGYDVVKDELSLTIGGMHCATCSLTVQDALSKVPGVSAANVNFALGKATVEFDPEVASEARLKEAVEKAGYKVLEIQGVMAEQLARAQESKEAFTQMSLAAALSIPVMVISMGYMALLADMISVEIRNYILFALATPVQFYAGWRYYRGAYRAVLNGRANMDTLVVMGTSAAWGYSVFATFLPDITGSTDVYFETSAIIITLVLTGKYLELKARGSTSEAIARLMRLQPAKALILRDGKDVEVNAEEVAEGDLAIVVPGERFPVDGVVVQGESAADESLVTGESIPVEKTIGSQVTGGTVNQLGVLRIRATRVGRNTTLAQIVRLIEDAQATKAPIERLADTVSAYFVPVVMAVAISTFAFWYFVGSGIWDIGDALAFSLTSFVAVLVIACPCALGLATPTAIVVGTGRGAQLGVLIKDAAALETAHKLTTVIFDKTGTLTMGRPRVVQMHLGEAKDEKELLSAAGSAEKGSEHVLSVALLDAARNAGLDLEEPTSSRVVPGEGVISEVGGRTVAVGNRRLLSRLGVGLGKQEERMTAMEERGMTVMACVRDGRILGLLGVADTLKPGVPQAVSMLKELGLKVVMLTGDNERTARAIASQAGISDFRAQVLPGDKAGAVKAFQADGETVAMVGDGINDAPALAQADIGIALGSGTDVALESGNIVLMGDDIAGVVRAIRLSRRTFAKIRQNLFWALAYNTGAIPIAMGVLYPFTGWLLSPMIAAGAMAFSSVSVVTNASLLKRFSG